MPPLPSNFGLLPPEQTDPREARAVLLPIPFERTTSYGKGTAAGPAALIRASQAMELYDEELDCEPAGIGIHTADSFAPDSFDLAAALREIEEECARWLSPNRLLVALGGEHSLSLAPVRAAKRVFGEIGVVQFDAHADLRSEFEGTPFSHACVMRRIHDEGLPTLAVGIRSLSEGEARYARESRTPILWGHELDRIESRFRELLEVLPPEVYLTFDVDFFDPSLVPATGTPEPGGGSWYPTLRLLRQLFESRRVVACDVVELAPIGGQPASDFLVARLVYKLIGYWAASRNLLPSR